MTTLVVLLGLAYLAGGAYLSYVVYNAVYKDATSIVGGFANGIVKLQAGIAALATMSGVVSIPLGIASRVFLFKMYHREGMLGFLPFIALERGMY